MLIAVSDTPTNERGPRHTKAILSALHKVTSRRMSISFYYGVHAGTVGLFVRFPDRLASLIKGQFYAKYPDCHIETLAENALAAADGQQTWVLTLQLSPDLFPIVRYQQYEDVVQTEMDDPVGGLLQSLTPDGTPVRSSIELSVVPATRWRVRAAQHAIEKLATRNLFQKHRRIAEWYAKWITSQHRISRFLATVFAVVFARQHVERQGGDELDKSSSRLHDNEKDLQAAAVKLGHHLFDIRLRITASAPPESADQAHQKLHEIAAVLNKFTLPRLATWECSRIRRPAINQAARGRGFLLSDEELATLWHLPTSGVRDAQRQLTVWRRREPPAELPLKEREPDVCELGRVAFQERSDCFGIRAEDRFRHLFLAGKTGNGKSTMMLNAIVSDMEAGRGSRGS